MEAPSSPGSRRVTGSDITRRELIEVAVVTGGVLAGGQVMSGFIPEAAAQAGTPLLHSSSCCASTEPSIV